MEALQTSYDLLKLPFRHKEDSRSSIQIPTPRMTSREIDYTTPRVLDYPIGNPNECLSSDTTDWGRRSFRMLVHKEHPAGKQEDDGNDDEYDYEFAELNQFCLDAYMIWNEIKTKETQYEKLLSFRSQLKSRNTSFVSERQKENMIKELNELEKEEKSLRLERTINYEDNKLIITTKKVHYLTLRRRRPCKKSRVAIQEIIKNINGILERGYKEFIDQNDEYVPLLNVLETIISTYAGQLVLDYADEKLRSEFISKYCSLKEWNNEKKKIRGTNHFYKQNHKLIDTLIGKLSDFQDKEVTRLTKSRKHRSIVVNEQFANDLLKKVGLDKIYAGFSKEASILLVNELIKKPGTLFIPMDPSYNEIEIAKEAFIKLKVEYIKEFEKLEKNPYLYVRDQKVANEFTRKIMDAGKLYLAIRSSLFFIINRVTYYYGFDSKKREEILDNFQQAMPTGGDFCNQRAWKWKQVHDIFAKIRREVNL